MPFHKPGIIASIFDRNAGDLNYFLNDKPLGEFDRNATLRQVPISYLVLAIGNICDENNHATPREMLHAGIDGRNATVLSYHLQSAIFSDGSIDLNTESEKVTVVRK
jgi:hypothetical protein